MELFPHSKTTRSGSIGSALFIVALFVSFGIYAHGNGYLLSVGAIIAVTSIASLGLSLVVGRAGQLSFGQAGFMAVGAYSSAWVTLDWHFTFLLGVLIGAVTAGVLGLIVGLIALRLRGNYLALATLASGAIVFGLLSVPGPLGGSNGLSNIPSFSVGSLQVSSFMGQYVFSCVAAALACFFSLWLVRSRYGLELAALRDDEVGAASLGIRIVRRKVQIFVLCAIFGGIAGALDGALQGTIAPSLFTVSFSIQLFLMMVLGGMGSIPGTIFGTALILGILQVVPGTGDNALVVMGVLVIIAMALFPGGLAGVIRQGRGFLTLKLSKLRSRSTIGPSTSLIDEDMQ